MKVEITPEKQQALLERIKVHKGRKGPLMPTLHDAQKIFGCIPLEVQKLISQELGVGMAEINGVVTFYSNFSIEPKGKYVIGVCLGTACYVRGSQELLNECSKKLKIKPGETTADGLFTLSATSCIGACGLAPVFDINGKVYGSASKADINKVLDEIIAQSEE